MSTATEVQSSYIADHAALLAEVSEDSPDWLRKLRADAIARFETLGFPTTKHEDWRYTNIRPIAEGNFQWSADEPEKVSQEDIDKFHFGDLSCTQLLFVDGKYVPQHSHRRPLPVPDGLIVKSLGNALKEHAELIEPYLAKHAEFRDEAFAALNTAYIEDGGFVYVPKDLKLENPIHLLFVSTAGDHKRATHPRNLIIVEDGGDATVLEDYASLGDGEHFTNAVTEVIVKDDATANHYLIERDNEQTYNVSTLQVYQQDRSNFASHSLLIGGAIVRNNVRPVLDGEKCDSLINGLYISYKQQHMDNHMRVTHAKPNCDSRQFYKGILEDDARAVFTGRIVVDQIAQKTDAKQSNMNLLLSDNAQADAMPQLEIYADDVKCTHGATVGQIDEEAIFYLMARGLSDEAARGLLIYAFAGEVLDRMTIQPVRDVLEQLVLDHLPEGLVEHL